MGERAIVARGDNHRILQGKDVNGTPKRILIVEDSLIVAMELREILKRAGYEITGTAVSGEEAIELQRETQPDLILMDIMLQGQMTGIEASAEIKKTSPVPIIYTTAYSDEETLNDLKLTDPFAYLKKPYDNKELLITIELAIERSAYQRKLTASEFKYRGLFDNSVDAIFIVGRDGRFIDFNISLTRLTGYNREDTAAQTLSEMLEPEGSFGSITEKIESEGMIRDYEVRLRQKGGEVRDCQITATSLYIEDVNSFAYQGIIRDITDLRRSLELQNHLISGIIQVMAATVEARDPYTAGHQERVAILSELIAREMGLPEDKINEIRMAAMIHDLGKIHIPSEILSKPTKLNDTEFELIMTHPTIGYEILKDVEFPFDLAGIVYQHHERCDGSGYPLKLKKDDIYLESRIISVADVVEAMASHRPYRPAQGIKPALEEIRKGRASRYDEEVVDAFCRLVQKKALDGFLVE
ncbi:MAG: HD domain-containing protein [Spirochaetes bacterium]|nr:HD domain-containing protein [Spirochaetota bacterium]